MLLSPLLHNLYKIYNHFHIGFEMEVFTRAKSFSKDVSHLIFYGNESNLNIMLSNPCIDKVEVNSNKSSMSILNGIAAIYVVDKLSQEILIGRLKGTTLAASAHYFNSVLLWVMVCFFLVAQKIILVPKKMQKPVIKW